ncbi:MAG: flagellar export chaperone FlgN [Planctomycetota bacterium]|nr:flagellar export chaperone FlgN [Planctomycetota bacterium]
MTRAAPQPPRTMPPKPAKPAQNRAEVPLLVQDLRGVMLGLLREHEELAALVKEQERAVRSAKPADVQAVTLRQQATLGRIAELESKRSTIVAMYAQVRSDLPAPTLTAIAGTLDEPHRGELSALAARLRTTIEGVRETQRVVGLALETLAQHMEGLVRQVAQRLSHAGVYSSRGRVEAGAANHTLIGGGLVTSALDIRS